MMATATASPAAAPAPDARMLKPVDPPIGPAADGERPVGDIVHQLVEDGKAYAFAEVDLAKTTALSKVDAFKVPAMLFAGAFLLVLAAVNVLAVAVFVAFAPRFGPILAGLFAFLIFVGIAGGFAWLAAKKLGQAK